MPIIIVGAFLCGFGLLIGVLVYCGICMHSLHKWQKSQYPATRKGWYHTWTR